MNKLCQCGCGREVKKSFVRGHNRIKGKTYEEMFGKEYANEIKIKIGDAHKGKKYTVETKIKMSESFKGRIPWNKGLKGWNNGHTVSKETRKKISKFHKGKIVSEKTKKKMSESKLGHTPWNKNLTKDDQRVKNIWKTRRENGNDKTTEKTRKNQRIAAIRRIEQQKLNGLPLIPNIGKYETDIINYAEEHLGIKFERNHKFYGYFIDGYNYKYKIAIEIDENHHFNINGTRKQKDIKRQQYLENKLGCKFIRIKDDFLRSENYEKNII